MTAEAPPARVPNPEFAVLAGAQTIARTADALRARGYDVHVAQDRSAAKAIVLDLVPDGAEVGSGVSRTLDELGVTAEIEQSGRYDALRPKLWSMDRATQMREIRKLGAAPDVWLNSAHALTEDGTIVLASASGSQLTPISMGAGKVIFAIGAQKIVPDLSTGLRRIEEYSFPLEDDRARSTYGHGSAINKVLIINGDVFPGRISVVLIAEAIGF
jgi:L-lactate utilization protein LutC